jgi:hypothetical protein
MNVFKLIDDLTLCYETKAPYMENYITRSKTSQENLCKPVREALINYVNSNQFTMKNIVGEMIQERKSKNNK